MLKSYQF